MIDYETAHRYVVEYNWSIFPVILTQGEGKLQKKPAIPWKDYMSRLPTDEELHTWFDTPRYNGLGLATGKVSGVTVVDLDTAEIPPGLTLESKMVARTPSGGRHFYYMWDEEMRNDVKVQGLPLDFRGDGGFVVLPPSEYTPPMLSDSDPSKPLESLKYLWEAECPMFLLETLPDPIKQVLVQRKSGVAPIVSQLLDISTVRKVEYGDGIQDYYEEAEIGTRNESAIKLAGSIVAKLPMEDWDRLGLPGFKHWNFTLKNPLTESEIMTTWESAKGMEFRKLQTKLEEKEAEKKSRFTLYKGDRAFSEYVLLENSYQQGISTGFAELDTFFRFIPDQLYLISAATHIGKTTLALNICSKVAEAGHEVLFCSLEQGLYIIPRIQGILGGSIPEALTILTTDKMLSIRELVEGINELEKKPELICIDHINFLKKKGVGALEDIDEIILELQNMAKALHVPIIPIAHTRKLNVDRMPTLDDLKDSSSLSQVPSVVMFLHRQQVEGNESYSATMQKQGKIKIAKNRIQGITGVRNYELLSSGLMVFNNLRETVESKKAKKEITPVFVTPPTEPTQPSLSYKDD